MSDALLTQTVDRVHDSGSARLFKSCKSAAPSAPPTGPTTTRRGRIPHPLQVQSKSKFTQPNPGLLSIQIYKYLTPKLSYVKGLTGLDKMGLRAQEHLHQSWSKQSLIKTNSSRSSQVKPLGESISSVLDTRE